MVEASLTLCWNRIGVHGDKSRSTPRRWRTWRRCSPLAATMPAPGACSNVRPVE